MEKTRIIDKIVKCLRLSESCNANEAASALRQAQRLMRKYDISDSEVVSARIGESSAQAIDADPSFWCVALADLVAEAFASRAYLVRRHACAAQWRFIGAGHGPQISAYTFSVLQRRLSHGRARFKQELDDLAVDERERQADVFAQAWLLRISRTVGRFTADPAMEEAIERYTEAHYGPIGEWRHAGPDNSGQGDYEAIMRGLREAERVRLFRPFRATHRRAASLEA